MGSATNTLIALAIIAIVVVLAALFLGVFTIPNSLQNSISNFSFNTTTATHINTSSTTTQYYSGTQLDDYALNLINKDRADFGLGPVTLASEASGQQHSQSMLSNNYFSHWDIYGLKPYMRYTALGARQSVDENVAFYNAQNCNPVIGAVTSSSGCTGALNVTYSLSQMEYSMMYNDSVCCNNGHRDNILDPNHNEVSIGIAYNSSTIYFTEDFIDDYISWYAGTPSYSNGTAEFAGKLNNPGYSLSEVLISFDPPVQAMSRYELNHTSSYGYGSAIAGVVQNSYYSYPNLTTIVANRYSTGSNFDIEFNMADLVSKHGAGEYTVMLWLNGTKEQGFIGSTYTIFIDPQGKAYQPQNI